MVACDFLSDHLVFRVTEKLLSFMVEVTESVIGAEKVASAGKGIEKGNRDLFFFPIGFGFLGEFEERLFQGFAEMAGDFGIEDHAIGIEGDGTVFDLFDFFDILFQLCREIVDRGRVLIAEKNSKPIAIKTGDDAFVLNSFEDTRCGFF